MKKYLVTFLVTFASICLKAADQAPAISLSEAALLAEKKIREKGLVDAHFLRSMQLTENEEGEAVFRAMYSPAERRRVLRGSEKPEPMKLKYIEVNMESEVSFIVKEVSMTSGVLPKRRIVEPANEGQPR